MDSGIGPQARCDRCAGSDDLYLVTIDRRAQERGGEALILCRTCRAAWPLDVSLPLCLLTPRLVLGLQRLRKLEGNLGRLILLEDRS